MTKKKETVKKPRKKSAEVIRWGYEQELDSWSFVRDHKLRDRSKKQVQIIMDLIKICGRPSEEVCLREYGSDTLIWVWRVHTVSVPKMKRKAHRKHRNPDPLEMDVTRDMLLILADRAQELGLQVYKMNAMPKFIPSNRSWKDWDRRIKNHNADPNNHIGVVKVTVWCPAE